MKRKKVNIDPSSEWKKLAKAQHNLNSPLNRVLLITELLREQFCKNKSLEADLGKISRNVFQVSRTLYNFFVIQSLLQNPKFVRDPVNLADVIDDALTKLPWELQKREWSFLPKINIQGKKDFKVIAHPILLSEVFLELFINATLFSKKKVDVEIKSSGKKIVIEISNFGTLSKAEIKTALTEFGSFGENKGSGLGLNFVKTFVEAVGGKFHFKSISKKVITKVELQKLNKE